MLIKLFKAFTVLYNIVFRLDSEFGGCSFKTDFLSEKCHRGNVAIYLGFSDLGGFIVESYRQIVDEKVTFGVVSVNH